MLQEVAAAHGVALTQYGGKAQLLRTLLSEAHARLGRHCPHCGTLLVQESAADVAISFHRPGQPPAELPQFSSPAMLNTAWTCPNCHYREIHLAGVAREGPAGVSKKHSEQS